MKDPKNECKIIENEVFEELSVLEEPQCYDIEED